MRISDYSAIFNYSVHSSNRHLCPVMNESPVQGLRGLSRKVRAGANVDEAVARCRWGTITRCDAVHNLCVHYRAVGIALGLGAEVL